jgi:hypothetical protein
MAEYVRIPHADTSLYRVSPDFDLEAVVLLSDPLGFHHALAILREHVLVEVNRLLKRRLGLDVRISLEGLQTPSGILAIRSRMERGDLSIGDAFEQAVGL